MKKDETTKSADVEQTSEIEKTESAITDMMSKQLSPDVKKHNGRAWLPYVITFGILAVVTVLVAWASGAFSGTDTRTLLGGWCDAFFVSGMVGVSVGLLIVVSNGGAFDIFVYGGKVFFGMFRRGDPLERKYGSYHNYREVRKEKKRSFWYLVIVGGSYLLVAVVLFAIYYTI